MAEVGGGWFGKINRQKKSALPTPSRICGKKIAPPHDTVGNFLPPTSCFKNMPLCCCCAPTTVIIHVMSLSWKKSLQNNALKKNRPPRKKNSMLKKVGPPPTRIGCEIFAPPSNSLPPPLPPAINNERSLKSLPNQAHKVSKWTSVYVQLSCITYRTIFQIFMSHHEIKVYQGQIFC